MRRGIDCRPGMVALLLWFAVTATAAGDGDMTVFEMAQPRDIPPGAPKYSDVCMRNLRVYSAEKGNPYDTIRLIKGFHVTRLDWTYGLSPEFVKTAHDMGVTVQGSLGSLLPRDKIGGENPHKSIGIENIDGGEVIAHWMRTEYWHPSVVGLCEQARVPEGASGSPKGATRHGRRSNPRGRPGDESGGRHVGSLFL